MIVSEGKVSKDIPLNYNATALEINENDNEIYVGDIVSLYLLIIGWNHSFI
jgi:hypothetical protein